MKEFVDGFKAMLWSEITGKMHTALPGQIESYDSKEVRAEVKPMVGKHFVDSGPTNYAPIVSVPVIFPRSGDAHISFPLNKGDGVLLIFSERSIEEWLETGNVSTPTNMRRFSITDAMAIPGLFATEKGSKIDSGNELEIRYKNIKISSDGDKVNIATSSTPLIALDGCVTGKSICAFTGAPHPDFSKSVKASS